MPPFRIHFKFNKLTNNLLQRLCSGVIFKTLNRCKMNIYKQICFIDPQILTSSHNKKWSIQGLWAEFWDGVDLAVKVVWKVTAQCIAIKELQSHRYRRATYEASEFAYQLQGLRNHDFFYFYFAFISAKSLKNRNLTTGKISNIKPKKRKKVELKCYLTWSSLKPLKGLHTAV